MIAPALTKNYGKQPDNSDTNLGPMLVPTAFHATQDPISGPVAPAMGKEESGSIAVAIDLRNSTEDSTTTPLQAGGQGSERGRVINAIPHLHAEFGVRRLTPTECERLQGLPDGWTQLGGTPDSRRYSALGDAVTANVSEWIGGRLAEAA